MSNFKFKTTKSIEGKVEGSIVKISHCTHVKGDIEAKTGVEVGHSCVIDGHVNSGIWVKGDHSCIYKNGIEAPSYIELGHSTTIVGSIKTSDLRLKYSTTINGKNVSEYRGKANIDSGYNGSEFNTKAAVAVVLTTGDPLSGILAGSVFDD